MMRIHLISQILKPTYAVTSNGGNILVDGQPDLEWQASVVARVNESSEHVQDVRILLDRVLSPDALVTRLHRHLVATAEEDEVAVLDVRRHRRVLLTQALGRHCQRLGGVAELARAREDVGEGGQRSRSGSSASCRGTEIST